jgi:hypothetical protein
MKNHVNPENLVNPVKPIFLKKTFSQDLQD